MVDSEISGKETSGSEPVLKSKPAEEADLEFIKYAREQLYFKSTDVMDQMAKNLVNMVSVVIAVFTSIVSYLQISDKLTSPSYVFFILSFLFWLISIYKNITVYSPRKYIFQENNPESIKQTIREINEYKYQKLKEGTLFFLAGLVLLIAAIMMTTIWDNVLRDLIREIMLYHRV